MTTTNVYQPGVCNIGPAEIRQRRRLGWIGLAVSVVFLVLAFALQFPAPFRLLVALPAIMGATGFLQGAFHFCVRFGTQGLFNFGELGTEEAVHETEYRKKDQRKAVQIIVLSLLIGVVIAVVAFLIPLP
jgi:heme/copper-type cytochrome/quinol oxidase subunit 4